MALSTYPQLLPQPHIRAQQGRAKCRKHHHHSVGPNTRRNPGGRQKKNVVGIKNYFFPLFTGANNTQTHTHNLTHTREKKSSIIYYYKKLRDAKTKTKVYFLKDFLKKIVQKCAIMLKQLLKLFSFFALLNFGATKLFLLFYFLSLSLSLFISPSYLSLTLFSFQKALTREIGWSPFFSSMYGVAFFQGEM